MRYMILTFASQQHYQEMVGQPSEQSAWTQEEWAALGAFMQAFNQSWWTRASWSRAGV